ncbi:MAG: SGNH/GDSL hydrolase family protein [Kiritimatiellae bacterium]|nr:SGNH/GDSL hydrolase family protein [Kiritimatiellia bacterium]MDD5522082.1 SGNH/GDSL hydrolase family protein [Kiritimatiellia bacterium]
MKDALIDCVLNSGTKWSISFVFMFVLSGILYAEPFVLEECDNATLWKTNRAPATVVVAPDTKYGSGAIKVTMPGEVTRTLSKSWVTNSAAWDRYEGVSFWVKGDGSDLFGCLALTGVYPYVVYFPLKNTEWQKFTFAWVEFAPEMQTSPLGISAGMPVSGINAIRLGSRWNIYHNNRNIPAHSFCLDHIQFEERVPSPVTAPLPRPFKEILDLLRANKPVNIQCMGDSITAGTGLPDKDNQRYAVLAQDLLRRWLNQPAITCVSKAVGGARTTDLRAWIPRDFNDTAPDLVTLWIGYNDKSGATTCEYFKQSVNDYIDRVCRVTKGRSAILLLATGPGCGPRFVMMDDYAEAVRELAGERKLPLLDIHRLLTALGREKIEEYFGDMAHPNEKGHRFIADALCEFLVKQAGVNTPKPIIPPVEKSKK